MQNDSDSPQGSCHFSRIAFMDPFTHDVRRQMKIGQPVNFLKKNKAVSVGLLLAAAVALGGYIYYSDTAKERAAMESSLYVAKRGSVEETVTAQGTLEPKEFVDVGAQVSGQLKKLHVEIGAEVKKGDLLAEIDPDIFLARVEADQASLAAMKAQLDQSSAQLELARQRNERNKRLIAERAVSQEALETSQAEERVAAANYRALQAQIKQAESNLAGTLTNLQYTKIYAPIDGTVVSQTSREGQTLNANQQAPIILQVADLSVMTVRVQVAEADVSRLRAGMKVYFTTLGNMERRWHGTVRQILPSPEIVNDVVLYIILIDVANDDSQLLTGMSTQVFFEIGRARDAVTIPAAALGRHMQKDDGDGTKAHMVEVVAPNGKVEPRIVQVGLTNRTDAEIRSGLKEGERVRPMIAGSGESGNRPGGRGPRMRGPML